MVVSYLNDLIIGFGEVGKGVYDSMVEKPAIYDLGMELPEKEQYDYLHICFPYSNTFIEDVKKYQEMFKVKYTIIHSTVPVGTSRKCHSSHSPIVGIHPELGESIKTFTKFVGGLEEDGVYEFADHLRRMGLTVQVFDKPETTELMKIMCTTCYGINIEFTKEVKKLCDKYNVPFEAWTLWNNMYNTGYEKMNHPEYHRYNLVPIMRRIGQHCVVNNCDLLENDFTKFIRDRNK
jgi:hypothetical protein